MYDISRTTPDSIEKYVNHIHTNLQLTPIHEDNAQVNFLDLLVLITRKATDLIIDIYRKPTTTDITINYISNHPIENKLATYRHYINKILSLPPDKESRNNEWETILNIARNNNFPYKLIINFKHQLQRNTTHHKTSNKENKNNTKRATFTYHSPKVKKVTYLFKHTNLKITFKSNSNNTILHLIRSKNNNTQFYNKSGVYKLTCKTCKHAYRTNKSKPETALSGTHTIHQQQ